MKISEIITTNTTPAGTDLMEGETAAGVSFQIALSTLRAFSYSSGSATFNPASLADGAGETTTVTVTGAALGDFAIASFSLNTQDLIVTAWVSAANTVSVRFQNETGAGPVDIASGTLRARVFPV